jgi:hypothetical protein
VNSEAGQLTALQCLLIICELFGRSIPQFLGSDDPPFLVK